MRLNTLFARAVRTAMDPELRKYKEKTIMEILSMDQVCFREKSKNREYYKTQLRFEQEERSDPLLQFMKEKYDVELRTFDDFSFLRQDPSYLRLGYILPELDPYLLLCLFVIAQSTKSTVIGLALLNEVITFEDAILMSRLEEIHQQNAFGVVEGAHDYDEARTISDVAAAKCFVNLCQNDM